MKPLLAHTYEPHRVTFPCYVQPKLNGIRALYQNGRFQSRDELSFAEHLLAHLSEPLKQVFDPSVILDGELYVHGWPLGRILSAVTPVRGQKTEDTLKVEYHVFDRIDFQRSFEVRRAPIEHFWKPAQPWTKVETYRVHNEQEADMYYANFVSIGYEGMMYRLGDCPYTMPKQLWNGLPGGATVSAKVASKFASDKNNRTWHLLKRKDWQDDEFPFVSIERTTGKLGEPGFVMTVLAKNGKPFEFGSGLTHAEVEHYLEHPPVGRLVKGKYLCLSADGIPQNGSILAIL